MDPPFIQVHSEVISYLEELHQTQELNHKQYKAYIEKNRLSKVFGLDSFYFQTRLFDLETKQLHEQYSFINNRIYCDYYKLYAMIKLFYKESFKLDPKKRSYPIYKDLETFKKYDIQETISLISDIREMIKKVYTYVEKNAEEIGIRYSNPSIHIENYRYNQHYNNALLKNKMELYEKYLHSYHIYHMSFLSHLRDKIMLLFRQTKNRVMMGNSEEWVEERLIQDPIRDSKYENLEKVEILIHPKNLVPIVQSETNVSQVENSLSHSKPLEISVDMPLQVQEVEPLITLTLEVPVIPVEVPVVPLEVPVVPLEVPVVPVEVPVVPVEVPVVPLEVPVVPLEVPVVPLEVPVVPLEVPVVPLEVPVIPLEVQVVPVEVPVVPVEVQVEVPVVPVVPLEVQLEVPVVPVVPLEVQLEVPVVPVVPLEVPVVPVEVQVEVPEVPPPPTLERSLTELPPLPPLLLPEDLEVKENDLLKKKGKKNKK